MIANKFGGGGGRNQKKTKNWQQRSTRTPPFEKNFQGNSNENLVSATAKHVATSAGRVTTWGSYHDTHLNNSQLW